jgi:eukaryotic-like serine/threonine-protein kinase
MVRVAYEPWAVQLPGLDQLERVPMVDYWIDRHEVTNAQYKRFVDAGAYRRPELWHVPFTKEGEVLPFEAAMALLTDTTGRPGPATWEFGTFPDGSAEHPVGGLSWYEAEAYARFAGKELPSIYHWVLPAFTFGSSVIIPLSNYTGKSAPVGTHRGVNRYGALDMAGSVREWCSNPIMGTESFFILGGGYSDPPYSFNDAYGADAFNRSPINGLRCIKLPEEEPNLELLGRSIGLPFRDFAAEKSVDDETFAVFLRQYDYDPAPLDALIESETEHELGTRQVVSFRAAYGDERVRAILALPKNGRPPLQTVVYFPGAHAFRATSSQTVDIWDFRGILASNRAVMVPILKGTYERGPDSRSHYRSESISYKEHVIWWGKDLRRSVDYLTERTDIDGDRLAYYGWSYGGALGAIMPAIETRLRCNVLYVAGLWFQRSLPEVDQIHYLPRVRQPTLMLNGELDWYFPIQTSQNPMFERLGAAPEHKRHEIYPGAHSIPYRDLMSRLVDWLDTYLGPVE